MSSGEHRTISLAVTIPAAICICAGLLFSGCGKDKAPKPIAEDLTPSPASSVQVPPVVVVNPTTVVVRVFGKTLTQGEVDQQAERALASPQLQSMPPDIIAKAKPRITKDIVDRFVGQCVLENEAEVRKISVDEKDREAEMTTLKASLPQGMTMEQMMAMSGMDMAQFNERVTQELKIRKLLDLQTTNIPPPSAEEVLSFYTNSPSAFQMPEHVRVRHILVALSKPDADIGLPGEDTAKTNDAAKTASADADKAEKRKKAEALREELVKGADFAELAKANSDCPSKAKGGDLGRVTKGQTAPEFEKAAFSQEVNAIGPVVETQFGFHIIQVTSKDAAGLLPLAEVQSEISDYLLNKSRRQAVMTFVDKLKAEAKVEYAK